MFRRVDPFEGMLGSWKDFDALFHRLAAGMELPLPAMTRRLLPAATVAGEFLPAVECVTREKAILLRVELPGVEPKDVEVQVTGNRLLLKGEKRQERQVEEGEVTIQEISRGRFERTFELPEGVKKEQVKAVFQNGVLEITIPAPALEAARKVPVEVTEGPKKSIKAA